MSQSDMKQFIPVLLTEAIDCDQDGLMGLINGVNTVGDIVSKNSSLQSEDVISFVQKQNELGNAAWLHEWSPLYWCSSCNLPLIQTHCDKCGSRDVKNILLKFTCNPRPVASGDEKMFRDSGLPWPVDCSWIINSYVRPDYWGHEVICDGRIIGNVTVSKIDRNFSFHPAEGVNVSELQGEKNPPIAMADLIEANRSQLEYIETETVDFIKQKIKEYPGHRPISATSGGKDSVVNIHLCSLASKKMESISIDTGIHPACHEAFHKDLFKRYPSMKLLTVSAGDVFWKGLEKLGPPANDFQWCKTIIKLDVPRKALRRRLRFFT